MFVLKATRVYSLEPEISTLLIVNLPTRISLICGECELIQITFRPLSISLKEPETVSMESLDLWNS
jgi:hypothetical protein